MHEKHQVDTTFVPFMICTGEPEYIEYFAGWDRTMQHVGVTRDFKKEKDQVRQCRGNIRRLEMGEYVAKALVGAIIPEIDHLNEDSQWYLLIFFLPTSILVFFNQGK